MTRHVKIYTKVEVRRVVECGDMGDCVRGDERKLRGSDGRNKGSRQLAAVVPKLD